VGLYELVEAFRELLREAPEERFHEVDIERLSVADRINDILSTLAAKKSLAFTELFSRRPERQEVVVSFLAMLELVKLRMVRLMQSSREGTIWIYAAVAEEEGELNLEEGSLGYC